MSNSTKFVNPAPLTLVSFGITTVLLSLVNANILTAQSMGIVLAVALPVGGVIQLLAGMWDFARNNMFGAITSATFGGFWLSFWFIENTSSIPAAEGVGYYLMLYGLFSTCLWVATWYLDRMTFILFTVLCLTFLLLVLGQFGIAGMSVAGGYAGIITGFIALYGAAAHVINNAAGKTVLSIGKPLLRGGN